MKKANLKDGLLRTYLGARSYSKAKNASLSANFSEIIRNGILFITISKSLNILMQQNTIPLKEFLKSIFLEIEKNLDFWLDISPDYSHKTECKARMTDKLCFYAQKLTAEEVELCVQNYAEQLSSLDMLLFFIEENNIEKSIYTIAEIFVKLFFKK